LPVSLSLGPVSSQHITQREDHNQHCESAAHKYQNMS
jgi:hypothetical protein